MYTLLFIVLFEMLVLDEYLNCIFEVDANVGVVPMAHSNLRYFLLSVPGLDGVSLGKRTSTFLYSKLVYSVRIRSGEVSRRV